MVGLFLVLTAQASLTAAATDTSDASTSGAMQGNLRIHLQGSLPSNSCCAAETDLKQAGSIIGFDSRVNERERGWARCPRIQSNSSVPALS
jgi:hypothetical protein